MQQGESIQEAPRAPRAFISHSSADRERVVRPLDELLRARGFQTWLDERDLLPGRNLVDEIFTHGIASSDVVIVVLTANSIDSKWVHEELTNAVVQKVSGDVKMIIPLILDGVVAPDCLKHTIWEVINDLGNLPLHADRIAASVFGQQPAPSAPAPVYAGVPVHRLPSLTKIDEQLFVGACRQMFDATGFYSPVISFPRLFEFGKSIGLMDEQVEESLVALEQRNYFRNVIHGFGERYAASGRISHYGMEQYLKHYRAEEYRKEKMAILAEIVNRNGHSSQMIAMNLNIHAAIVEHVFQDLENGDHVIAVHHSGGVSIHAKPTIKRVLRELEDGK